MEIPSLPDLLRQFALHAASPAVVEAGAYRTREYSYARLIGQAEALAQQLRQQPAQDRSSSGLRPDTDDQDMARGSQPAVQVASAPPRCLIWGASGAAWLVAFWGCVLAGVVAVPFDAGFSREYADRVRRHTGARFFISDGDPGHGLDAQLFAAVWNFEQLLALPPMAGTPAASAPAPETLLEIVYTSGSTAEPKGVMITHGNLLANLRPIAHEIEKYGTWERRFRPLGFLHLIPLSHLFGQVMGAFIPGLLGATVVFTDAVTAGAWADLIHRRRISVLIAVPRQVRQFSSWALREAAPLPEKTSEAQTAAWDETHARQMVLEASSASLQWLGKSMLAGIARRWWRWRRLHRKLGWKFWALIAGGAALPVEDEELWHALGYAVVQGYGLTETAPALAITHPFKIRRGAVGRKLAEVELKIAPDGEILARGGNVSPGYFRNQAATAETFADGWLHTGDLGRFDAEGNLIFLGRKKDVIVSAEGMNIYPQEVEAELEREPEIQEAAVVADPDPAGRARAHAVLAPAPGATSEALDRAFNRANARLEVHQRMQRYSVWPEGQLPRTLSTHKLRRNEITAWLARKASHTPAADAATQPAGPMQGSAAQLAHGWRGFFIEHLGLAESRLRPEARLQQDLGLSSLDRAELLSWLEQHGYSYIDEGSLAAANTLADLERLLHETQATPPAATAATPARTAQAAKASAPTSSSVLAEYQYPRWPENPAIQGVRRWLIPGVILPVLRTRVKVQGAGAEHLAALRRPVLFIANHQSLLDAPAILRALPADWRPYLAPLMSPDHFRAAFSPAASAAERRRARRQLMLTQLFFHTSLLSERIGVQKAIHHAGRLADAGYCPLLFPEGARTPDGRLQAFRGGVGVFVKALQLPVIPVWLAGLFEILPAGAEHAHSGTARVTFGPAMHFDAGASAGEITRQLEAVFQAWQRQ